MRHCLNEETLQVYLDGAASDDVISGAIAHLAECANCAARAREAEQALAAIGGAIDDERPALIPTARLRARIESAVAERLAESSSPSLTMRNIFWRGGLVAASALVVAGVIGWFASRSFTIPGPKQPAQIVQEKRPNAPTVNPTVTQQPATPPLVVRDTGHGQTQRLRSVKKQAIEPAQTSLSEPTTVTPALTAGFADSATFFDFETTRHLEKAQVLLRSFENTSSPSAKELAYDKRVSRELLLRNILLRREAEGSENAPAKSLLSSLEPLLLDIAHLPARPAAGDLNSVKKRIRKSEIVVALQVYSSPLASLE